MALLDYIWFFISSIVMIGTVIYCRDAKEAGEANLARLHQGLMCSMYEAEKQIEGTKQATSDWAAALKQLRSNFELASGGPLWKTAAGDVLTVRQMSLSHLRNLREGKFGSPEMQKAVNREIERREADVKFRTNLPAPPVTETSEAPDLVAMRLALLKAAKSNPRMTIAGFLKKFEAKKGGKP